MAGGQILAPEWIQASSQEFGWQGLNFMALQAPPGQTPAFQTSHHLLWSYAPSQPTQIAFTLEEQIIQNWVKDAGYMSFVPAGQRQQLIWHQPLDLQILAIAPATLESYLPHPAKLDLPQLKAPLFQPEPILALIVRQLHQELLAGRRLQRFYLEAVTHYISAHLLHHLQDSGQTAHGQREPPLALGQQPKLGQGLAQRKLRRVLHYVATHLDQEISLEVMAEQANTSPYHFSRLFKQSTGLSPYQYVIQARVEQGYRLLLEENLTVAQAAERVGFMSPSQFTKHFKRILGISPKTLSKQ